MGEIDNNAAYDAKLMFAWPVSGQMFHVPNVSSKVLVKLLATSESNTEQVIFDGVHIAGKEFYFIPKISSQNQMEALASGYIKINELASQVLQVDSELDSATDEAMDRYYSELTRTPL